MCFFWLKSVSFLVTFTLRPMTSFHTRCLKLQCPCECGQAFALHKAIALQMNLRAGSHHYQVLSSSFRNAILSSCVNRCKDNPWNLLKKILWLRMFLNAKVVILRNMSCDILILSIAQICNSIAPRNLTRLKVIILIHLTKDI